MSSSGPAPAGNPAAAGDLAAGAPPASAAVAVALAGLDGLADRPLAEHVAAFERVHAALAGALGTGPADEA